MRWEMMKVKSKLGLVNSVMALLLVTIVVSASFFWLQQFTLLTKSRQVEQLERVLVDDVWFWSETIDEIEYKYVNVSIHNYGDITLTVDALYITEEGGEMVRWVALDLPLQPDGRSWVKTSFTWTKGTEYLVKVSTKRGNTHESLWTAW